jgi:malate dehydrogenase (oxaloacetate-decarboxylating)
MCVAAAEALAGMAAERGMSAEAILPTMDDWEVFPREAAAVAVKAVQEGVAQRPMTYDEEFQNAAEIIRRSRNLTQKMMADGFIIDPDA